MSRIDVAGPPVAAPPVAAPPVAAPPVAAPPVAAPVVNNAAAATGEGRKPVVELRDARLTLGSRVLWEGLDLTMRAGEFIAVLGPNGSGKTSLLRVLLGLQQLTAGTARVSGQPVRRGSAHLGYVPQQKTMDPQLTLRGRDLVRLGLDGHRWGIGVPPWRRAAREELVATALAAVGATGYAHRPIGRLSGGEQQRLRIAQAVVGNPEVLLCDEPLLSLDLAHQQAVAELIDARRRRHGTTVLFVTHDINPVLPMVDRVLYLVEGRFRVGPPDEVMTSQVLSQLYRTHIDVLNVHGRIVVVGGQDAADAHHVRNQP